MTILASLTLGVLDAEAGGEVVDREDLAAQRDDAADAGIRRGDRARLGVADDLVDLGDRQRVLLLAEREDDELARRVSSGMRTPVGSTGLPGDRPGRRGPLRAGRARAVSARGAALAPGRRRARRGSCATTSSTDSQTAIRWPVVSVTWQSGEASTRSIRSRLRWNGSRSCESLCSSIMVVLLRAVGGSCSRRRARPSEALRVRAGGRAADSAGLQVPRLALEVDQVLQHLVGRRDDRELAWKPRWATIMLVNSGARSTLDISSVPPIVGAEGRAAGRADLLGARRRAGPPSGCREMRTRPVVVGELGQRDGARGGARCRRRRAM